MDIHAIKITQKDLERVSAEIAPAETAGFVGDACTIYTEARPVLLVAGTVLKFVYPAASEAITAVVAILDASCKA